MQTKPKANSVITSQLNGKTIVFTVAGCGEIRLDMTQLNSAIIERAQVHGLTQRVQDAAAIARDTETGKSATPQAKYDAMRELVDHYLSGTSEWALKRSAPGVSADASLLRMCLLEKYPSRSEVDIRAWVEKRTRAERAGLLMSAELKEIADRLRAAQAGSVNAGELLMDLETQA